MGTPAAAVAETSPANNWKNRVDQQIETLGAHAGRWAALPLEGRIAYLEEVRRRVHNSAHGWVAVACRAKGLSADAPAAGEEWGAGPWALTYSLNRYLNTLREFERAGRLTIPEAAVRTRPNGQVVAKAFPENAVDNFLLNGIHAEVWMDPAVKAAELSGHMGGAYRDRRPEGGVALVLGAGNVSSIAPLDALHKMLFDHHVVLLKVNPVNDYLGPIFEDIFQSLVRDGFLAVTHGGPEMGEYIATHPGIHEIHITGSDRTHDAIVWGTGAKAEERKRSGTPLNSRPITSELGNVTPLIVVPGPWDETDIRFQAEHIATTKLNNAGFNCIATQVLVMPQNWDRADSLLDAVRGVLRDAPARKAYYPGAAQRQKVIAESHPATEVVDDRPANEVARLMVTGLDCFNQDESLFREECFASVLSSTTISGASAAEYLRTAVRFCNEKLWGTLGATILIHPATVKELGPAFEDAIAELRYGTVGVNVWCGIGFLLAQLPWGAFPGHTLDDIGSGIGMVHNTKMFDRPQKSVLYGPFYPYPRSLLMGSPTLLPKPPWFVLNKRALEVNKCLADFEYDRNPSSIRRMFVDAMLG